MIISASRRTDIPAFYSDWFINRIKEGFLYLRNPFRFNEISRISLKPELVDCIVFWTKNPSGIMDKLDKLSDFNFYFQITLTPYNKDIERNVVSKTGIIQSFARLSSLIGSMRTIWRYDPILFSKEIDLKYHLKNFEILVKQLLPYTQKCIISFIDNYKRCSKNLKEKGIRELTPDEVLVISYELMKIAATYNLKVETCAENYDLSQFGIEHSRCIDPDLIEKITGKKIKIKKDKNQRKVCGCVESLDIGTYNTCYHDCIYCYANYNKSFKSGLNLRHDPDSPLLTGYPGNLDKVSVRDQHTYIDNTLF